MSKVEAIRWRDAGLFLLDQRLLPGREQWIEIQTVDAAISAIFDLVVRGAPAIGITAAYASVLAARARGKDRAAWECDLDRLEAARPTAVNLRWALRRMRRVLTAGEAPLAAVARLQAEAERIHAEDRAGNLRMAEAGSALIEPGSRVLTHCNTGSLATGGTGTALGVIVRSFRDGRIEEVYACETRPWLQGLRLTAWEFDREGVPCRVLVEGAAAGLLASGRIDWVITGADRVTANGDVANKIGTFMLAALARQFGARMMVVAPVSTLDPETADGGSIEIEQRSADEIWRSAGITAPPLLAQAYNPVFDVTPAEYIDAIVTDRGVLRPPFAGAVEALVRSAASGS
ncbi:MAG: S-methyl-5-thioribose-1-phosphate isomerase [Gammaproteobacteria bacterium HGW-Gammaproteobacteria-8]|nr:MAG: S-methyl-5-thioribose-1-phosphate isomerase [Gammaproteobacteria bacterium HGW-Gammaproteobacteria-8]